jgi:hypothetical protein
MRRDTTKKLAKFTILFFLATLMLVGTSATFSAAQEPTDRQEESSLSVTQKLVNWWEDAPWRFELNVYGWLPQAPANIEIGGTSARLQESLGTIWDSLHFAAMGEFEIHKGPVGIYVMPIYVSLLDREHIYGRAGNRRRNIKVAENVFLCDFGATYEVGQWRLGKNSNFPRVTLEPFAGARYLHDNLTLDVDPGRRVTPTIETIGPIIGARTALDISKRWSLNITGDYGGWKVDRMQTTWQGIGTLAYHFKISNLHTKAFVGYRYLHLHYEKEADIKVAVKGPLFGIGIEF